MRTARLDLTITTLYQGLHHGGHLDECGRGFGGFRCGGVPHFGTVASSWTSYAFKLGFDRTLEVRVAKKVPPSSACMASP